MGTKAIRLQIIKPYDEETTWEELGKVLRDARYAATKIANFVITKLYLWELFRIEYKEQHGLHPKKEDFKEKWYWYPEVKKRFLLLPGSMKNQIGRLAESRWRTDRNKVLSLEQSLPSFKLNFPIVLHNRDYTISKENENYIISLALQPKETGRTRFIVIVNAGDNSKRAILDRIIGGKYKQGACQIVSDRKRKWYVIIPYQFEAEPAEELDHNRVLGIDLGESKAAYWAVSDSPKRGYIEGGEINEFRRRVRQRRIAMQRQIKHCGEGRRGHGRKRALRPIKTLEEKEANFRKTTNHRYAKRIVAEAIRYKCGVIQMEDLTGISESKTFLKNWTFYDLQTKIKEKAAVAGIQVNMIEPQYTSQRCHQCGHIEAGNRQDQATFKCKKCGLETHADYNAAKNISLVDIEKLIKEKVRELGLPLKNKEDSRS